MCRSDNAAVHQNTGGSTASSITMNREELDKSAHAEIITLIKLLEHVIKHHVRII